MLFRMIFCGVLLLFLVVGLASCGGSDSSNVTPMPNKAIPQWTYQKDGLEVRFKADPLLNLYDNVGHTVVLCMYQLTDPNGFNTLIKTKTGLEKLVTCDKSFDPTAVTFQKFIIQPGEDQTVTLPRAEKAKWLGVAAGFYTFEPSSSTRLFEFPVTTKDDGVFTEDITRTPGKLMINLFLGPQGIQQVGGE